MELRLLGSLSALTLLLAIHLVEAQDAEDGCTICTCLGDKAFCELKGLTEIPRLPADITKLNLRGNWFKEKKLSAANFTHLPNLMELTLSNTTLSYIQPGTFSQLKKLRKLDLSSNKLVLLEEATFAGCKLKSLKLSRNYALFLNDQAFKGCELEELYLSQCNLRQFSSSWLRDSRNILTRLDIDKNSLRYLDEGALKNLTGLKQLNVGANKWDCGCELRWFKQFYDRNTHFFIQEHPSCSMPLELENNYFQSLHLADFNCRAPVVEELGVVLDRETAVLTCVVSAKPKAQVFWLTASGDRLTAEVIPGNAAKQETRLTLPARPGLNDIYRCSAVNTAGNVSAVVTVAWPSEMSANSARAAPVSATTTLDSDATAPVCLDTVTLVGAIVATLLVAVLLLLVLYCVARRLRRNMKRKYKSTQERVFLQKVPLDAAEFEYSSSGGSTAARKFGTAPPYSHNTGYRLHVTAAAPTT